MKKLQNGFRLNHCQRLQFGLRSTSPAHQSGLTDWSHVAGLRFGERRSVITLADLICDQRHVGGGQSHGTTVVVPDAQVDHDEAADLAAQLVAFGHLDMVDVAADE